jgi:hypothetical protein
MNPIIHLFSYLCLAGFFHYALSAEPPGPDFKDLARIYERTLAAMAWERPEFTNQYKPHPASSDCSIYHGRYGIPFYRIEAPIHMTLYPDSYRVCSIVNTPLQSFLDAKQYTNSIIPKDNLYRRGDWGSSRSRLYLTG